MKIGAIQRRPILEAFVNQRLNDLSASLGNGEYLEDRFTAADLFAYKERCEARSAFQRALRAQMQDFERNAPPDGLIRVAQGGSQMNVERKE